MRTLKIIATVVLAYAALMILLIGATQYAARSRAWLYADLNMGPPPQGFPVHVMLYREYRLPFGLNGGPSPGTVKLVDFRGNVLDEDRISDIRSIEDVQFFPNEEKATFTYLNNGRRLLVTLNATD